MRTIKIKIDNNPDETKKALNDLAELKNELCGLCHGKKSLCHDNTENECFNYTEYSIGSSFVTALVNADLSGLESDDLKLLLDFEESNPGHIIMNDPDQNPDFTECDISGLHDNCYEFRIYKDLRQKSEIKIDSENFFDVAEAIHAFCTLWHSGQCSELYSILSQSEFKPGMLWNIEQVETENIYYSQLTEKNIAFVFQDLQNYLAQNEEN